jgi:hypothetical protein
VENCCGCEVVVVVIDVELEAVSEGADIAMEPVVSGVYGCLRVQLLPGSYECRPGDVGVEVDVLPVEWGPSHPFTLLVALGMM